MISPNIQLTNVYHRCLIAMKPVADLARDISFEAMIAGGSLTVGISKALAPRFSNAARHLAKEVSEFRQDWTLDL